MKIDDFLAKIVADVNAELTADQHISVFKNLNSASRILKVPETTASAAERYVVASYSPTTAHFSLYDHAGSSIRCKEKLFDHNNALEYAVAVTEVAQHIRGVRG